MLRASVVSTITPKAKPSCAAEAVRTGKAPATKPLATSKAARTDRHRLATVHLRAKSGASLSQSRHEEHEGFVRCRGVPVSAPGASDASRTLQNLHGSFNRNC